MTPRPAADAFLIGLTQFVANALIPAVGEVGLSGMVTSPGPSPLLPLGVAAVGTAALCSSCWSLEVVPVTAPATLPRGRGTLLALASTGPQALFPLLTLCFAGHCVTDLARGPAPTPTQSTSLQVWALLTALNVGALVAMVARSALRAWIATHVRPDRP